MHGPQSISEYSSRKFVSDILEIEEFQPSSLSTLRKSEKSVSLEFLGYCQTSKDIFAEFSSFDELNRMRQTYLLHVMDYIC